MILDIDAIRIIYVPKGIHNDELILSRVKVKIHSQFHNLFILRNKLRNKNTQRVVQCTVHKFSNKIFDFVPLIHFR